MFILSNFIIAVAEMLRMIFSLIYFLLIVRAVLSWVNPDPYNDIVRILYRLTDPILIPLRNAIPFRMGAIDISPLLAFLLLKFADRFLITSLVTLAQRLSG